MLPSNSTASLSQSKGRHSRGADGASMAPGREIARVERALRTLTAANRTLLRASEEIELLREMCVVVVEQGGYRHAAVAYANHDEAKTIRWMASCGVGLT